MKALIQVPDLTADAVMAVMQAEHRGYYGQPYGGRRVVMDSGCLRAAIEWAGGTEGRPVRPARAGLNRGAAADPWGPPTVLPGGWTAAWVTGGSNVLAVRPAPAGCEVLASGYRHGIPWWCLDRAAEPGDWRERAGVARIDSWEPDWLPWETADDHAAAD